MADVATLDGGNFDSFMKAEGDLKVVRFWATWCRPCLALEPIYTEVAGDLSAKAAFGEVDIDQAPDVARAFGIRSVPTVLLFKDGKPVDMIVGLKPKDVFADAINKAA